MAKKVLNYNEQINVLCPDGTRVMLIAIAFHRGYKGRYGKVMKDIVAEGIEKFLASLSPRQRAEFDEILATVKTSDTLREQVKRG